MLVVAAIVLVAVLVAGAPPAAADHGDGTLGVTVSVHAAGGDAVDLVVGTSYQESMLAEVVAALGLPNRYKVLDDFDELTAQYDESFLAREGDGSLLYRLNTGRLQVLAASHGYTGLDIDVCVPPVRHRFEAVQSAVTVLDDPSWTCKGWLIGVNDPPVDGRIRLFPDRDRYSAAVWRVVGLAALMLVALAGGAVALRAKPLRRRTWASWLVAGGVLLFVPALGWVLTTIALFFSGAPADGLLIGGGGVLRQTGRTMLPGLLWIVPGVVPALLLLLAPKPPPLGRAGAPAPDAVQPAYWQPPPPPLQPVFPPASPLPPVEARPAPPGAPAPPGSSGWPPPR